MNRTTKFPPEVRERAVRVVVRAARRSSIQWSAIESIAPKIGCTAQTLPNWVRQYERDSGQRAGVTTAEHQRIKALEREVKELHRARS